LQGKRYTLLQFPVVAQDDAGSMLLETPCGRLMVGDPDDPDSDLGAALAEFQRQQGSLESLRAVHRAMLADATNGIGTYVRVRRLSKGHSVGFLQARIEVLWLQRIDGRVTRSRLRYHSLWVPEACVREHDSGFWLPVGWVRQAVVERLRRGSDFTLPGAVWLDAEALWEKVFVPAAAVARSLRAGLPEHKSSENLLCQSARADCPAPLAQSHRQTTILDTLEKWRCHSDLSPQSLCGETLEKRHSDLELLRNSEIHLSSGSSRVLGLPVSANCLGLSDAIGAADDFAPPCPLRRHHRIGLVDLAEDSALSRVGIKRKTRRS
jgi:hypothetical protein